ncbi:MAG: hypothetical protein A2452_05635 [Candidatus Firestonebacteria bacterium RIFOXYC2_FULL_39_67]|nr:MAG: hypothetical protein A2536_10465 [Candidatus Firestonebacteria bacterium RIFOXYD2_FULL_39_29]OGF56420.1 MAG: hypothetical protein A2452_05635 [Candidatus Firestonebacteria bacterium RIFOXYC2_FULL_39_67]
MNTNKIIELYAEYVWPVIRLVVRRSRRCRRCILSEHYGPLIGGLCAECREQGATDSISASVDSPEVKPETKVKFDRVIKSYINGNRYHGLLLLSGGKDSAYILNRMKAEYPELRLLCVTVNNGFMSTIAMSSAVRVAEKLKTDLIIANDCINEFAKVLRQAFLDLKGRGSYGIVDFADGDLIFNIGQRMAKNMGVPLVIGGLSWVQVQRICGNDDFEIVKDSAPHIVFPLAVWRTNEQEIRRVVRSTDLLPKGSDSPIVSNNTLILTMSAIDVMNLGYCSFEPEFAQLVREGKTDRNTWLHVFELLEFATHNGIFDKEITRTLAQLDMSLNDIVKEKKR